MSVTTESKIRLRGVPAKVLTSQGYAVCLFPEQPKRVVVEESIQRSVEEEIIPKTTIIPLEAPFSPYNFDFVRVHWRNRLVYLLALTSFTLSLNNLSRFPLNVYRYGDKFLFLYTIFTIVLGYPFMVLQTIMGQFSQKGVLWVWECAPLAAGVGISMLISCFVLSLYQNVLAAYSLVYFANCWSKILPWNYCTETSFKYPVCAPRLCITYKNSTPPSEHYFYFNILNTPQIFPSNSSPNSLKWWLILSLFFSWFVVYVATMRSARSIGKFAIFLVIFIYFSWLTLIILALQLPNSTKGVKMAFAGTTSISLLNFELWTNAAVQVILELGLSQGIPLAYSSFNHFRNIVHVDSFILCIINYLNSIGFFLLFFLFWGHFSCNFGGTLPHNGLATIFIIYSEIVASLKWGNFWCILFFAMLFCMIIGTQVGLVEALMTALYDHFPKLSRFRWLFNIFICVSLALLGCVFCTDNGFHFVNLLDSISIPVTALLLLLIFVVTLVLIYKFVHFCENVEVMLGTKPGFYALIATWLAMIALGIVAAVGCFFIVSPSTYQLLAWMIFAFILAPFLLVLLARLLFCIIRKRAVFGATKAWVKHCEDAKAAQGPFARQYSSDLTWEWAK